jgi:predicted AlkP superfamily pyrophosphatase or phosphodiesterase
MKIRTLLFLSALSFFVLGPGGGLGAQQQDAGSTARRFIIFVWDGLRADDVTPDNMPNYFALARSGVVFADHHAVYPTFTMMNSASIATGMYSGVHGFYGNVVYAPSARGKNTKGRVEDEDPRPRRELHLLRPGQSDPRIGFADPPGFVAFASGPR